MENIESATYNPIEERSPTRTRYGEKSAYVMLGAFILLGSLALTTTSNTRTVSHAGKSGALGIKPVHTINCTEVISSQLCGREPEFMICAKCAVEAGAAREYRGPPFCEMLPPSPGYCESNPYEIECTGCECQKMAENGRLCTNPDPQFCIDCGYYFGIPLYSSY